MRSVPAPVWDAGPVVTAPSVRGDPPSGRRRHARVLAAGMSAVTASALPPFLVGALAVQVRAELGFDAA
ncbi:MAG: hypothetical protein KDB35_03770, partial [Acidimicrobiales bacterium]|nr:hypothetical protein [Acidimicrobiales bacterium]